MSKKTGTLSPRKVSKKSRVSASKKNSSAAEKVVEALEVQEPDEILHSDVDPILSSHPAKDNEVENDEVIDLTPTSSSKELALTYQPPVPVDALTQYLLEIRKYPLLTPQEEKEIAIKYKETGDRVAAEKLVTSNLRFVVKIAAEYSKFGAKMIDLIQEGNVGLMHAVREFNPYKGVRLITYAVWWIRGYIREYLLKQYSLVKIGTTHSQRKLFYNLQQEKNRMESMGEEVTIPSLSARLGISEKDVEMMSQRMSSRDMSLDQSMDEESQKTLMDLQSDPTQELLDDQLGRLEMVEKLKDKINEVRPSLNPKEIKILEERILADEPRTLQEIGNDLSITRERARQLEARILEKLKAAFIGPQEE